MSLRGTIRARRLQGCGRSEGARDGGNVDSRGAGVELAGGGQERGAAAGMKSMVEVWFAIAKEIHDRNPVGPFLCNIARTLKKAARITDKQHAVVRAAVDRE